MPKHLQFDPSDTYEFGSIKVTRLKATIYIYLFGEVIPWVKRNCSNDSQAMLEFYKLKRAIKSIRWPLTKPKRSLWQRIFKR